MKRPLFASFIFIFLLLSACSSPLPGTEDAHSLPGTEDVRKTEDAAEAAGPVSETKQAADLPRTVNAPLTGIPDYTLPAGASADEIRAMALKAMRDALSVKWTPNTNIAYHKEGVLSDKLFQFQRGKVYAGVPYADGGNGLIQFLQYYDFETGTLLLDSDTLNNAVGNMCGGGVMWGWSAVCPDLGNGYVFRSGNMSRAQGVLPLGPFDYPGSVVRMGDYGTDRMCAENGADVMYFSYANLKTADGLTSSGGNVTGHHTVMVIENAHVERGADGKIDPKRSFVRIQDQRGGAYPREEDGQTVTYNGRTEFEITFETLFNDSYVPLTLAVFTGEKPYEPAVCSFEGGTDSLNGVLQGSIRSNYMLCAVEAVITDGAGATVSRQKVVTTEADFGSGEIRNFSVKRFTNRRQGRELWCASDLQPGKTYTLALTCICATGQSFAPLTISFTA